MCCIRQVVRGITTIVIAVTTVSVAFTAARAETGPFEPVPLEAGIEAYNAGDPVRALGVFSQLVQLRPQSALVAIWAGIAATAAGRADDAEAFFREGLRRPHTDFQDRVTRGWLDRLSVFRQTAPTAQARPGTPAAIAMLAGAANPRLTRAEALWIGEHILAAARKAGVDPWLLAAVVYIESRFNQSCTSWAGAIGLGQLMPRTARAAGVNPKDPWGNLLGAALVLRANYLTFGDWRLALAAYNAGETAVRRHGGIPPYAETRWYVSAVWTIYHQIRRKG